LHSFPRSFSEQALLEKIHLSSKASSERSTFVSSKTRLE
jgi:hypothetical protein